MVPEGRQRRERIIRHWVCWLAPPATDSGHMALGGGEDVGGGWQAAARGQPPPPRSSDFAIPLLCISSAELFFEPEPARWAETDVRRRRLAAAGAEAEDDGEPMARRAAGTRARDALAKSCSACRCLSHKHQVRCDGDAAPALLGGHCAVGASA